MKLGAIEAGGTKFVCAVGTEKGEILEKIIIPTQTPEKTLSKVIEFFQKKSIESLGIGSFGPIDINKKSDTYGAILNTPKFAWRDYPFLESMKQALDIPIGFTTDVNEAALGEFTFGAAKGLESCLYITVGTGIGAGMIIKGKILQGLSHPEMGHIIVRRHPKDDYLGGCPTHQDCLEGLASGPAIENRWRKKGIELSEQQEVWEMEAYYLAQALVQYIMILMPQKIIIGGGVAKQKSLFLLIRKKVKELLNGYLTYKEFNEEIRNYIVPPELGDCAGIIGGLVLAKEVIKKRD